MKRFNLLLLVAICLFAITACETESSTEPEEVVLSEVLFINEFLASNDTTNADENGDFDDWVEIYNSSDEAVDIGGIWISDNTDEPLTWQIPATDAETTTIPAGGFIVIWCDKESEQGLLHVDIKLSGDGEAIVLTDSDGLTEIDSYTFGAQDTGISEGRSTDGGDTWTNFATPTPGASNN